MTATTSLGMGVNVPDVERIVVWDFPRSNDPSDTWQKLGRGGRGYGRHSDGYVFLPFWAFDSEGTVPPPSGNEGSLRSSSQRAYKRRRTTLQNSPSTSRAAPDSPARRASADVEIEDTDAHDSELVVPGGDADGDSRPTWTQVDLARRANISPAWKQITNAACFRSSFLSYLGEDKLPLCIRPERMRAEKCCNRCNPSLFPPFTVAPELLQPPSRPTAKSRAGIALQLIEEWMAEEAEKLYDAEDRRFPMTACAFLHEEVRWQLAQLYAGKNRIRGSMTLEMLVTKVPALTNWKHLRTHANRMVEKLWAIEELVDEGRANARAKQAKRKRNTAESFVARSQSNCPDEPSTEKNYQEAIRARDDSLAIVVARRQVERMKAVAGSATALPVPRTQPVLPSALRQSLAAFAASPGTELPALGNNVPQSVRESAIRLAEIRQLYGRPPERKQDSQVPIPEAQETSGRVVGIADARAEVLASFTQCRQPLPHEKVSQVERATPECSTVQKRVPLAEVSGNRRSSHPSSTPVVREESIKTRSQRTSRLPARRLNN